MSLILDALNRSRQDSEPVPGLGSEHFMAEQPKRAREYLPWAGLFVALLVIAGLLLETGQTERVSTLAPVAEEISPAPAQSTDTPPVAEIYQDRDSPPAIPTAENQGSDESVSAIDPPPRAAPQPLDPEVASLYQQPLESDAPPQVEEPPTLVSEVSSPRQQTRAQSTRSEEALDIEKMVRQARDELANADLADHPAPFIADLSQQSKDAIPTVYYQRHNYSGNPGGSRVGLNGQSLKVGESPVAGMRVKEILPDSVVLDYRGTEFRLRALNSWVNL